MQHLPAQAPASAAASEQWPLGRHRHRRSSAFLQLLLVCWFLPLLSCGQSHSGSHNKWARTDMLDLIAKPCRGGRERERTAHKSRQCKYLHLFATLREKEESQQLTQYHMEGNWSVNSISDFAIKQKQEKKPVKNLRSFWSLTNLRRSFFWLHLLLLLLRVKLECT